MNTFRRANLYTYFEGLLSPEENAYFRDKLNYELELFRTNLKDYLEQKIEGEAFTLLYFKMADDSDSYAMRYLYREAPEIYNKFEYWSAMYEDDPSYRGPPDGYIGDKELREYAKALLDAYPKLPIE